MRNVRAKEPVPVAHVGGVIFAFTDRGKLTALKIQEALSDWEMALIAPEKLSDRQFSAYTGSLPAFTGAVFDRDALIFVGAAGIAVRAIAPHVASKKTDPAVICVDESGQFVVPILSGHIGGANRLARRIASSLKATPVITTATDVNGRFSVDTWATEHHMFISSMALAKRVSAEILTRDIPVFSDAEKPDHLAEGLIWANSGPLGIWISPRKRKPFEETLQLIPKVLTVGLGCRRGTSAERISAAVQSVFEAEGLCLEAIRGAASIDLKADEIGLSACCEEWGWPIVYYTAEELRAVPGHFTPSAFVQSTVGVDNVCERAAAANGGRVIVHKTAQNGVTVAVSEMKWGINFG